MLRVGNVVSYLKYSTAEIENAVANDDATEKEEKKVETEYLFDHQFANSFFEIYANCETKVVIPTCSFQLRYFPEVLTPPPSA